MEVSYFSILFKELIIPSLSPFPYPLYSIYKKTRKGSKLNFFSVGFVEDSYRVIIIPGLGFEGMAGVNMCWKFLISPADVGL